MKRKYSSTPSVAILLQKFPRHSEANDAGLEAPSEEVPTSHANTGLVPYNTAHAGLTLLRRPIRLFMTVVGGVQNLLSSAHMRRRLVGNTLYAHAANNPSLPIAPLRTISG